MEQKMSAANMSNMSNTSNTSIKLSTELKARVAELAKSEGKTVHAWLVEAVTQQVARAEMRASFVEDAWSAAEAIDAGAAVYAAEEVHAYLVSRAAGNRVRRPRPLPSP
jgi:predicted transcriptional regulator